MRVYLASGWFTPKQKEVMDKVRNILLQEQFKIFAPYYDGLVVTQENDSSEIREKTYNLNIKSINALANPIYIVKKGTNTNDEFYQRPNLRSLARKKNGQLISVYSF